MPDLAWSTIWVRLVVRDGDRVVAHLAVLRRFLRVAGSGASLLVGDVGLVAVDPDHQGCGPGADLLARAADLLRGFSMCTGLDEWPVGAQVDRNGLEV